MTKLCRYHGAADLVNADYLCPTCAAMKALLIRGYQSLLDRRPDASLSHPEQKEAKDAL